MDPALNAAAADPEWKFQKLGVGDIVYRNYLGYTVQEGIYGQAEYTIRMTLLSRLRHPC